MRKLAVAAVSSLLLVVPQAVRAQQESGVDPFLRPAPPPARDSGFTLALRLGYGIPFGDTSANPSGAATPLGDLLHGEIPIWIDVGYRFARSWFVGAYLQLGLGIVNKDQAAGGNVCNQPGVSCKGSDVRLGVEGTYGFSPGQSFNPWIGLGTGYEWVSLQGEGPTGSGELTFKGWEWFDVQVGGDFSLGRVVALGPYAAFGLGQYSSANVTLGNATFSGDVANRKVHGWLQLGVKGTFTL